VTYVVDLGWQGEGEGEGEGESGALNVDGHIINRMCGKLCLGTWESWDLGVLGVYAASTGVTL
jgi:hypothetical protein